MIDLISILLGKTILLGLRATGRSGEALPGLVIEKINPKILTKKLSKLPKGIIVVSGTNGKTTVAHLISSALERDGMRVLHNTAGSNMTRGLISTIIKKSNASGKLNYDIAVLEIDEAYAAILAPQLKPHYCIVTNIFRDQLDRFGEIDKTAKHLRVLVENTTRMVVYNGQDNAIKKIVKDDSTRVRRISFGVSDKLLRNFPSDNQLYDARKKVNSKIDYSLEEFIEGQNLSLSKYGKINNIKFRLAGWHNALNLVGAWALVSEVLGKDNIGKLFDKAVAPEGRGEEYVLNNQKVTISLVKNPAGFNIVLKSKIPKNCLFLVNDNYADGRDTSWLWDVDFSKMEGDERLFFTGTRSYEIANRLKYENHKINPENISEDEMKIIKLANEQQGELMIYTTYTGLTQVKNALKQLGAVSNRSSGDKN